MEVAGVVGLDMPGLAGDRQREVATPWARSQVRSPATPTPAADVDVERVILAADADVRCRRGRDGGEIADAGAPGSRSRCAARRACGGRC